MEFPTKEQFEQNKIQLGKIIKWREVPTEVIYYLKKVEHIKTKEEEKATILILIDKDGKQLKAFATPNLINDLKDYKKGCFIKSIGKKKSSINPDRSYYKYEIMKR